MSSLQKLGLSPKLDYRSGPIGSITKIRFPISQYWGVGLLIGSITKIRILIGSISKKSLTGIGIIAKIDWKYCQNWTPNQEYHQNWKPQFPDIGKLGIQSGPIGSITKIGIPDSGKREWWNLTDRITRKSENFVVCPCQNFMQK